MNLIKKKFVCPYCFSKQDLYKIKFRCQNSPTKCTPVVDNEYANFRGSSPLPMSKVFDIPLPKNNVEKLKLLQLPRYVKCPHCSEPSSIRICPNCHSELPYTLGDYENLIFAVVGAKESGKSHYISVLINTIENQISSLFNASLQKLDEQTIRKYNEEFYNPIYKNKKVIPETRSARGDYNVKIPMVFSLSFMKKNIFGKSTISNVTTISLFDTAGEDLNSQETMKTENKYIYNSSGIILLVDPLQIIEVRNQLISKGVDLPAINTETEDIVSRVSKLVRTALNLPVNKLIEIPIAVAFSKIDALKELIGKNSSLFDSGKHEGFFNLRDSNNINTEIETIMSEWMGPHLIQQIKHNFKYYSFFGLSALGSNPGNQNNIEKLRPIRVEDPFLWLLYKNKIIHDKNILSNFRVIFNRFKFNIARKKYVFASLLVTLVIVVFGIKLIQVAHSSITKISQEIDYTRSSKQIIYYRDLVGNYYGSFTDASNVTKVGYMIVKQNPLDSTKFFMYLKYDVKKTGLDTELIFNKDSMSLFSEILGVGILSINMKTKKIILVSKNKNTSTWQFEK